jgi:HEAT repeat protein
MRAHAALSLWQLTRASQPSVGMLADILSDQEDSLRYLAIQHLVEIGFDAKSAALALRRTLRDKNEVLANEAALGLWRMGMYREEALRAMTPMQAVEELVKAGLDPKPYLPAVTAELKHYDPLVRIAAAETLGNATADCQEAVAVLSRALHHRSEQVCREAATKLAELGGKAKRAVPALLDALQHDDFEVYQAVSKALRRIDPAAAARALPTPRVVSRAPLSRPEMVRLWQDLTGSDSLKSYRAFWRLTETPSETVLLFEEFLKPVSPVEPKRLAELIANLGSNNFNIRDQAHAELSRVGELAETELRKTLSKSPSLELSRRIKRLLDDLQPGEHSSTSPRRARLMRTIEVLEFHGTGAARGLLEKLTHGAPAAWLTQEARLALTRLDNRSTPR